MPLTVRTARRRTTATARRTGLITIVTGGGPIGGHDHRCASTAMAEALPDACGVVECRVFEATAGTRLAPGLAGAGLVVPSVPGELLAPLAALCEWLEIPYAGASPRASTLAADAELAALALDRAGLDVVPGLAVDAAGAAGLDYLDPVRIRPAGRPGPFGRSIATTRASLRDGLHLALALDERAYVEEIPQGMAVMVPVLDDGTGNLLTGAVHEIAPGTLFAADRPAAPGDDWHDAHLSPTDGALVRRAARAAYRALGMRGVVSVEIILDGRRALIGAIDPAPAQRPHGLTARQFAASGTAYPQLVAAVAHAARG